MGTLISSIVCKVFIDYVWGTRVMFKYYFDRKETEYTLKMLFYLGVTVVATAATFAICYFAIDWQVSGWLGIALIAARAGICIVLPNLIFFLFFFKTNEFKETMEFVKLHLHRNKEN